MYSIDRFGLANMIQCGAELREFGLQNESVEVAAEKVVRHFFEKFVGDDGQPVFALVRLFKTVRFDELEDGLKQYASGFEKQKDLKYLALMATAGLLPQWNDRKDSKSDRLIPVTQEILSARMPMIARLFGHLEIEPGWNVDPSLCSGYVMEPLQKRFNVFYIDEAKDCPFINGKNPVQRGLVEHFGVRSVLGYGGALNRDSFYCVTLFARTFIPKEVARLFNPLALSTKNALTAASDFRKNFRHSGDHVLSSNR
jgi:hypothetical protein